MILARMLWLEYEIWVSAVLRSRGASHIFLFSLGILPKVFEELEVK